MIVIARGICKLFGIFEMLAKREAKMGAILDYSRRTLLIVLHFRHFNVREAIGLKIRETPIGIAEAGPRSISVSIRRDCRLDITDCF